MTRSGKDSQGEHLVRIGCGSGFAMDRLQPALDLAASGRVDYLAFDSLAERTLAMAQVRKRADANAGYDVRLNDTVDALAPYVADGLKVVGSFGAANVEAAAQILVDRFQQAGHRGIKIAAITGDDVLEQVRKLDPLIEELGKRVSELGDSVVSANAYIGAREVVEALGEGAQWVVGGRLSDPSLYVGPIIHEMGWSMDDWDRVAHATLVGHILECSTHATGGFFADPPYREVPGIGRLPFPFAEVGDGSAVITKLNGTGGLLDERVVAAQVSYEVHDPAAYTNPDIVADFTQVTTEAVGPDRVRVQGARGNPRPATAKVLVGVDVGWKVVGEISYAAAGCLSRARVAEEIMADRIAELGDEILDSRQDIHGVNTLVGDGFRPSDQEPVEVRVRTAARTRTREAAERLSLEVERLYLEGPAGGGGVVRRIEPALAVYPIQIDASQIHTAVRYLES
ncbi:acyclic terpene utilization AtuA family protein [Streptomyces sp. NPDC059142]|uniref:acyclic terpene utilization AtuA family protein n=1 Tax=Streptomyces sp. NPDC059142 TaxID=3346739 RepID=UPI00369EF34F